MIVGFDGVEIGTTEDLQAALDLRRAGDEVELQVQRDGGVVTMNVTLDPGA